MEKYWKCCLGAFFECQYCSKGTKTRLYAALTYLRKHAINHQEPITRIQLPVRKTPFHS